MNRGLALLSLCAALGITSAFAQTDPAAMQWLQRVYAKMQKLSYTGTFVYHHDSQVETSRITRIIDASGPVEKLETLDGVPREIVRSRNQIICYLPESMTIKIDKQAGRATFPLLLPDQIKDLAEHYVVRKGDVERVAGYESQVIVLEAKDRLRYGHRLWADLASGMLVKAKIFNENQDLIEMFAFTQLQIGGPIDRDKVKSRYAAAGRDWRVEDSGAAEANLANSGWNVRSPIAGYKKVTEMIRTLGGTAGVGHVVFSDGLAAVSVFIEPAAARVSALRSGLSRQGAINVYKRHIGDYWVTVIGEAPAESVKYIANAVEYRRR